MSVEDIDFDFENSQTRIVLTTFLFGFFGFFFLIGQEQGNPS